MSPAAQRKEDAPKPPTSDLGKDLEAGNAAVEDYLNAHAIKQGAYIEDVEESEQNKDGNVEVDDHSAELSAQEVADGSVEEKPKAKAAKAGDDKKS